MRWRTCGTHPSTAAFRMWASLSTKFSRWSIGKNDRRSSRSFLNDRHTRNSLSHPARRCPQTATPRLMIAFRDNLPLIEHVNGVVAAFERKWLTRSLFRAAAKAGYDHWWLSDHVAQSVTEFL